MNSFVNCGLWNTRPTDFLLIYFIAVVATEKARENDLTIGPIIFAFDRSPANQERVSDDETEVSDFAGDIPSVEHFVYDRVYCGRRH